MVSGISEPSKAGGAGGAGGLDRGQKTYNLDNGECLEPEASPSEPGAVSQKHGTAAVFPAGAKQSLWKWTATLSCSLRRVAAPSG